MMSLTATVVKDYSFKVSLSVGWLSVSTELISSNLSHTVIFLSWQGVLEPEEKWPGVTRRYVQEVKGL